MSNDSRSLQEVAELLGVHYMTVYRYVRLGHLAASKEHGRWVVTAENLAVFQSLDPPERGGADWAGRVEARMLAGDASGAWGVIEAAMASGADPAEIYTGVLTPALHEIGNRWAEGAIGIDEEHLATAVAMRLVGRMHPKFARRGRKRGMVVLASPAGEHHGLATAMVADLVRSAGYESLDLGCDVPSESLVATLTRVGARVLAISVTLDGSLDEAKHMISVVRDVTVGLIIAIGGRAVTEEQTAIACGAHRWTPTPRHLIDMLDTAGG